MIQKYHDSDALLAELDGSFVDGFDDCFHQVKASFPNLDLSHISIDPQAQTPAQPVYSESTNELFVDDTIADPQGNGETTIVDQAKSVGDEACPLERDQAAKGKDGEDPVDQE